MYAVVANRQSKATEQGYREHCSPSCMSVQLGDNKDEKRITGRDRDRQN